MTLNRLNTGKGAKIISIAGDAAIRARIKGLGLRLGQEVTVIRRALMGGPLQVRVGRTDVLIRPEQADLIGLTKLSGISIHLSS